MILIASRGGAPTTRPGSTTSAPTPRSSCGAGGGGRYRAREAEGAERERLWELATAYYPGFAKYQERCAERRIPVIVCSPIDG